MSGISQWAITAVTVLSCQKCTSRWESPVYDAARPVRPWGAMAEAAQPAFDAGWRVYVGRRTQHTYCPEHGPSVPMRQVYPR